MISLIAPDNISTTIQLPPSKSISNRALIIHALSKGKEPLYNLSDCDDTEVMINALNNMPPMIDIGAAGTSMRFLTAYFSTLSSTHILTGTERMKHRPIKILVDALRTLGAHIEYINENGFPPIRIKGCNMQGGEIILKGDVSSQYISALLLIAPTLQQGLIIHLIGHIISRSYINLTLELMKEFGINTYWEGTDRIIVEPSLYQDIPYLVESDWSAASYWYEIATLCPNSCIRLTTLRKDSFQGDRRVASIFTRLGIRTKYTKTGVDLTKVGPVIKQFADNFADVPDLAQTVITTCCIMNIPFHIDGLQTLKIKETDRIEALKKELRKLGFILKDENDGDTLIWDGEHCQFDKGTIIINTYEDHRMAMAFAPAAFKFSNICIENPSVVTKSYPKYWKDLQKVGFQLKECN